MDLIKHQLINEKKETPPINVVSLYQKLVQSNISKKTRYLNLSSTVVREASTCLVF